MVGTGYRRLLAMSLYECVRGRRLTLSPRTGKIMTATVPTNLPAFECSDLYGFISETLRAWDVSKLCLAPPFPEFWMEYAAGQNIYGGYFRCWPAQQWLDRVPSLFKSSPEHAAELDQYLAGVRWVITVDTSCLKQGPTDATSEFQICVTADEHGLPLDLDAYERVGDIHSDYLSLVESRGYDSVPKCWQSITDIGVRDSVLEELFPLLLAFSYAGDKRNVVEVRPSRQQRRQAERKQKPAPFTYHVLKVKLFEEFRKRGATQDSSSHSGPRLHEVRANWAFYPAERPLFGKVVGMVWRPSHLRGNPERGAVDKNYEVAP